MNRIAFLRKQRGLSQKEVAKTLNIAQNTLSQYETGKRITPPIILNKIAEMFDVTPSYILGETDVPAHLNDTIKTILGAASDSVMLEDYQSIDELCYSAIDFIKDIVKNHKFALSKAANYMEISVICFNKICCAIEKVSADATIDDIVDFIKTAQEATAPIYSFYDQFINWSIRNIAAIKIEEANARSEIMGNVSDLDTQPPEQEE